ncbi:hypothetical protein [Desertivirga brevis]|uniref:hypothetical protein n=1 Tax=Desertivirga brevis TaxID=2810310 RepID=UPI001A972755|nr:hypothetical protein [Pedobacter sp. SYSU D00873]
MQLHILIISTLFLSACFSDDPKSTFAERTGLTISESTSNLVVTDGYAFLSGEYSIVFRTTNSQIKKWLASAPPWNNGRWHKGSIPHNIGVACQFNFKERVGLVETEKGEKWYYGDDDLSKLLNDTTNYFSYVEDCCSNDKGLRFHDRRLLIIQPATKMVYYSVWDY